MVAEKVPSKLKNNTSFSEWKKQIRYLAHSLWLRKKRISYYSFVTIFKLKFKKQKKQFQNLKFTDLNVDNSFDKLITKLDETFKTEKIQES